MSKRIKPEEWQPRGIDEMESIALTVVQSNASMCVVAGPGAGKTELLAQRATFLLETGACPYPKRILAISFKRDAAKNLRLRVQQRCGEALARRLDSMTFDAFAKGILDQFRQALPPTVRPTPSYDVLLKELEVGELEEILRNAEPPAALAPQGDVRQFATRGFFSRTVPLVPLIERPSSLKEWAGQQVWQALLHNDANSKLSFPMILRLATALVQSDARVRRAYRASYSHVFLDEFQDTTEPQYHLTTALFKGTRATLTAVGDPQQRIMGWAGAMPNSFSRFVSDFDGGSVQLLRNHRASAQIAPIIRFLAKKLSKRYGSAPHAHDVDSFAARAPSADACAAHFFADDEAEASWIAGEIVGLISAGVPHREIAVLVRIKAVDYGERLIDVLRSFGYSARVEDRIQDLLTEPIIETSILALRALASPRPRAHWSRFRSTLAQYGGFDATDADSARSFRALELECQAARKLLRDLHPTPPRNPHQVRHIINTLVEPLLADVRRHHAQYQRGAYYEDCLSQFCQQLQATSASSWDDALDEIEGIKTIPILTIHKSKGLEYHTVFFVGLEDGAFWNFNNNPEEESYTFYVALSRAKQRVVFTFAERRTLGGRARHQDREKVRELYELVQQAGVRIEKYSDTGTRF